MGTDFCVCASNFSNLRSQLFKVTSWRIALSITFIFSLAVRLVRLNLCARFSSQTAHKSESCMKMNAREVVYLHKNLFVSATEALVWTSIELKLKILNWILGFLVGQTAKKPKSVPMAQGKHLYPFRTQQLSLVAVTILGGYPWENSTVPFYRTKTPKRGLFLLLHFFEDAMDGQPGSRGDLFAKFFFEPCHEVSRFYDCIICYGKQSFI